MQTVQIEESWRLAFLGEFEKEYFSSLTAFVCDEYMKGQVYPHPKEVFRAFELCPFTKVKVVLLGQDPYHGAGQAHGLCFSVPEGVRIPPSLQNIFQELKDDLGTNSPQTGNLERWAHQGVLLLNAILTVRSGAPGSHQGKGWETFTDHAIRALSYERIGLVFLLWGNYARAKRTLIDPSKHLVLEAAHPSPYSARSGFFGCKHFSRANEYLASQGTEPILW